MICTMSSVSPNGPDSDPVPYKSHRSSSDFGSTGITSSGGTANRVFWIYSIIALVLIVTGATLLIVGAPDVISLLVIGAGVICVILGIVVLARERAAAAGRRRVSRSNARR